MAGNKNNQKINLIMTLIFILAAAFILFLAIIFDTSVTFEYIPLWLFYVVSLAILLPLLLVKSNKLKIIIFVIYTVFLFMILPEIRWNYLKEFYIDAGRIKTGFPEDRVDMIMKNYLKNPVIKIFDDNLKENDLSKSYLPGKSETEAEHDGRTLYVPKGNPADWCIIYYQDGKVKRKEIYPD